jgi:hypothetical protein
VRKLKNCTGKCKNKFTIMELVPKLSLVIACYSHGQLEQYSKQKVPVRDSQSNPVKNCMYINENERGDVQRNIDVIKPGSCTSKYKNRSTRQ